MSITTELFRPTTSGGSWQYPQAGYAQRDEIWQAHKDYTAGLFYFLATIRRYRCPFETK